MTILPDLQTMLQGLCDSHGFTCVSIDINTKQSSEYLFSATLHYPDPLSDIGCSSGSGPTIARALNNAGRNAAANRPNKADLVSEL